MALFWWATSYPGDGDGGGNGRRTLKFSSEFQVLDLTEARTRRHHMIYHVKKEDFDFDPT